MQYRSSGGQTPLRFAGAEDSETDVGIGRILNVNDVVTQVARLAAAAASERVEVSTKHTYPDA